MIVIIEYNCVVLLYSVNSEFRMKAQNVATTTTATIAENINNHCSNSNNSIIS